MSAILKAMASQVVPASPFLYLAGATIYDL